MSTLTTFAALPTGLALALGLLAVGCAPPPVRLVVPDACRLTGAPGEAVVQRAVQRASAWLKVEPLARDIVACSEQDLARLARGGSEPGPAANNAVDGRRLIKAAPEMLAVRSFAGADTVLAGRSYIYDNALALLWFAWTGDEQVSRGLASTLVASQGAGGAWGAYLPLDDDDCYNDRYVRSGIVGWAAYALSYYARKYSSDAARKGAEQAAGYLEAQIVDDPGAETVGLVQGGRGRWVGKDGVERFEAEYRFSSAVTEHQFDAHQALAHTGRPAAAKLAAQVKARLWLKQEGRFALAAHPEQVDSRRALDAAGAWGALWLADAGDEAGARRSLSYTRQAFATRDRSLCGYRPYLDPVEGPQSVRPEDLIFVEGTLGVGLAAHRLGDKETAREALGLAVQLSCSTAGGLPYANVEAAGFSTLPGVAPTLWFLLLEREMRLGKPSPLFRAARATG